LIGFGKKSENAEIKKSPISTDLMQRFLTKPVLAIVIIVMVGGAGVGW
jgi:hypothetical protein